MKIFLRYGHDENAPLIELIERIRNLTKKKTDKPFSAGLKSMMRS